MTLKLGLIAGRHPLPVDGYLLESADPRPSEAAQLYEEVYQALSKVLTTPRVDGQNPRVDLYLTGLTRAAVFAIDILRTWLVDVLVYEYDAQSGKYVPTMHLSEDGQLTTGIQVVDGDPSRGTPAGKAAEKETGQ